ncbi:hypothetical protein EsVE80_21860 [Enterococcus saigonensis]|uniref:Uncharacterized protein n=1 Tax=Enterococcus saigonensis TaxID=1805431 RepID=A0A679IEV2_9ENTE|nr:hypothetical protein [Enterococcus saigonensis]BCA86663.1 hypothetical protein EsVE80_21860 [Enterococcus saigonensis]
MSGRRQVIKIGEYYYVEDYNAGTSLALNRNIQNATWFDSSIPHHKTKMEGICLNYGGVICDLIDELQSDLTEVEE